MFKNLISSKKFLLILAFIAFPTLILAFLPKKEPIPKLLQITPPDQGRNVSVIGTITAEYDISVDSSQFVISSVPPADWKVTQSRDKILTFASIKPLERYTKYTLTINWGDQVLHTLSFTTQDTQQDYEVIQNVKDEIAKNYPLARLMPLETSNFRIIYSQALTLEITIKNPNLTSAEVIAEVKSWVTQNGGDAESHKYIIAAPSPVPTN